MKKRIFIAMHYMEIGGAESSLIGLLDAFESSKVDVDLFVFSHQGEYMAAIPQHINVLPERADYSMLERPIFDVFKKGHLLIGFARLISRYKTIRFYKHHPTKKDKSAGFAYIGNEVGRVLPNLYGYGEYDLAISYNYPHNIVLDKVKARKKVAWLHTDYRNISVNEKLELPIWSGYDSIVSISPDVTTGFLTVFPQLTHKMIECENILPKAYIEKRVSDMSEVSKDFQKGAGEVIIVSVGRISNAKNYDNIPYMAKALKEFFRENRKNKYEENTLSSFHWYIIGPGDHAAIDALSEKLCVSDVVTFLGSSSNPYPYIKACDIYVHPSRYEGKSIVVREAQMLCKPVIITNYPTAKSQIHDGVDGIICDLDNVKIAESIYQLAIDEDRQNSIISYLQNHDYSGIEEVNIIYKLIK